MKAKPQPSPKRRYLIAQQGSADLAGVLRQLQSDPGVDVVKTGGLRGSLEHIVAEMPEDRADQLRSNYSGKLIVEEDSPL